MELKDTKVVVLRVRKVREISVIGVKRYIDGMVNVIYDNEGKE